MSKEPNLTDVTSGFQSSNTQNQNNARIKTAFKNTLSRDGSTPNTMEADLDMNDKDILNVDRVSVTTLVLNGTTITPSSSVGSAATSTSDGLMSKEDKVKLDTLADTEFDTIALAADSDADVNFLFVKGYNSAGDLGHAYYKKVSSEPFHEGKFQTSASWYELIPNVGYVFDKQFGVVGDGVTDDTTALQNAINFTVHNQEAGTAGQCTLRLLSKAILVTDTVHWLYGDGSGSVHVEGFARPFRNEDGFNGTTIFSTVTDRMLTSICGARSCTFRNILVKGLASTEIINLDRDAPTYEDEATWNTALTTAGYTNPGERYAPRAAWMVDGYTGTKPTGSPGSGTEPYPAPTLPSYISPGDDGYGRTSSSRIDYYNCGAAGAELGFGVGCSVDGLQGDYCNFYHCTVERCKIGHSVGQSQSRGVNLEYFQLTRFFIGVTNDTHGAQIGRYSSSMHLDGGSGVNLISFNSSSVLGQVSITGEVEALHRIGDTRTGGSSEVGWEFDRFKFNFKHDTSLNFPANVLNCNNSATKIKFKNCVFNGFGDAFCFFNSPNAILEDDCRTLPKVPINSPEAIFINGTAGFVGELSPAGYRHHEIMSLPYTISSQTVGSTQTFGRNYNQTGRDYCIPLWSRHFAHPSNSTTYIHEEEMRPNYYSTQSHSTIFASGAFNTADRTISSTIVSPSQSQDISRGGQPGDFYKDRQTGTVVRVESKDYGTGATVYRLLTNTRVSNPNKTFLGSWTNSTAYSVNDVVKSNTDYDYYICTVAGTSNGDDSDLSGSSDSGVTWVAVTWEISDTSFDITINSSERVSLATYTTQEPLFMTTTASTNTITAPKSASVSTVTLMGEVPVGDALKVRNTRRSPTQNESRAIISSKIDGTSFTMGGVMSTTWPDVPVVFFQRKYT